MVDNDDPFKQYAALLEKQKGELKKAKAYKGQKPSDLIKRSRWQLEQEFTEMAFRMTMLTSQRDQKVFNSCFIGDAYPPCTLPLSSLTPIHLRDLTLETQHRGRVLIVKAFSMPNRMTSVQNAVEDELGDVERLAIYNLLPTVAPNDILPSGSIVAIKEPYYKRTADGGLFVRVDHPSDFVSLSQNDKIIPPRLAPRITNVDISAFGLKEDGNVAFKKGRWQAAVNCYSDALKADDIKGNDELRRTLHRNRSGAHLRLGHYELAITDALASIIPPEDTSEAAKSANIKALYRAGKAAYSMVDFLQAKQYFKQASQLDTHHEEARAELRRTEKRLTEQQNGDYNWSMMVKSATKINTRLDHASFLKNTKIDEAGHRGRGLFATKLLKAGDLVFVEKAFHTARPKDDSDISVLLNCNSDRVSVGTHALRLYGITDILLWNPTLARKYFDLFDGGKFGASKEAKVIDGKVAVDTFQVQSIAEFNGFGCPRVKSSDTEERKIGQDHETSTGIWLQASYANHSCLPNLSRAFIGDMMIVRASRDIPAGSELYAGYISPTEPLGKRQKMMKDHYGFQCDCPLCQAEVKVQKTIIEKRARLLKEIERFLSENPLTNLGVRDVAPIKQAKARNLLEMIQETYPRDLYEHLPRLDCVEISLFVSASSASHPKAALSKFLDVLRNIGYFVDIQGRSVTIERENAVEMLAAEHTAMYAAGALVAMGNRDAALALEAFAKGLYLARSGIDEGFETQYGRLF